MNTPTRILLVDGQTLFREGLRCLLSKHPGLSVVGEAPNGRVAIEVAQKTQATIVVTDIVLPVLTGFDVARNMTGLKPQPKVVILSDHDSQLLIKSALQCGVTGYFLKGESSTILCDGLSSIAAGKRAFSPFIMGVLSNLVADSLAPKTNQLSPREVVVLKYLAEGLRSNAIAERLGLSSKTVDAYRDHIKTKLGLRSTADYIRYAAENRLVETITPSAQAV